MEDNRFTPSPVPTIPDDYLDLSATIRTGNVYDIHQELDIPHIGPETMICPSRINGNYDETTNRKLHQRSGTGTSSTFKLVTPVTMTPTEIQEMKYLWWGKLLSLGNSCREIFITCSSTEKFRLGRSPTCDEVISNKEVSAVHCEIFRVSENVNGKFTTRPVLLDTSINGTWLNSKKIKKNTTYYLNRGDEISLLAPIHHSKKHSYIFQTKQERELLDEAEIRRNPVKKWKRGGLIGKGGFASVYLGMNLHTGELIALKQVESVAGEKIKALECEINTLSTLSHPNIVGYLGFERNDKFLTIHLEYVSGGSIEQLISKFSKFQESVAQLYISQSLQGLEYLHSNNFVHRDIKPANLLVTTRGIIKLADFGLSYPISALPQDGNNRILYGTPIYLAPECIRFSIYTEGSDVWALGCTLLEMVTGKAPWSEKSFESSLEIVYYLGNITSPPQVCSEISDEARDFINHCFQLDHTLRPSCKSLLQHPFICSLKAPTSNPNSISTNSIEAENIRQHIQNDTIGTNLSDEDEDEDYIESDDKDGVNQSPVELRKHGSYLNRGTHFLEESNHGDQSLMALLEIQKHGMYLHQGATTVEATPMEADSQAASSIPWISESQASTVSDDQIDLERLSISCVEQNVNFRFSNRDVESLHFILSQESLPGMRNPPNSPSAIPELSLDLNISSIPELDITENEFRCCLIS